MFYLIEKLKGTPDDPKGLLFGEDGVYNYFVSGCRTPKVKERYTLRTTEEWDEDAQKFSASDFIKQVKSVMKRPNFVLLSKQYF